MDPPLHAKEEEKSKQLVEVDGKALKKVKTVPSVDKVMATTFWDSHGIIFISNLQKEEQ